MSKAENMVKEALPAFLKNVGVRLKDNWVPIVAGAGGLGAGALGGGLYAKNKYEPVVQGVGDSATGQYYGDIIGARHEVEDFQRDIEEGRYDEAADDFAGGDVIFKPASVRGVDQATAFASELSKLAAATAHRLVEAGALSKTAATPYLQGTHDYEKCTQLFKSAGIARLVDEQLQQ